MLEGYLIKLNEDKLGDPQHKYIGPKNGIIYKTRAKPKAWLKKWGGLNGEVIAVTIQEEKELIAVEKDDVSL